MKATIPGTPARYYNYLIFCFQTKESPLSSKMVKVCFNNPTDDGEANFEAICEADIKEEPMDFD